MIDINSLNRQAKSAETGTKKLFEKLKKNKPNELDGLTLRFHEEAFEEIDCLSCGNCCRTTSPIFYQKDIERIARHFRFKPSEFIEKYLKLDEDNDYVFKSAPCPFLGDDNYCSVYEYRPNACREYPHTDRKRFYQILNLTLKNTFICPAAFQVVEKLKKHYNG